MIFLYARPQLVLHYSSIHPNLERHFLLPKQPSTSLESETDHDFLNTKMHTLINFDFNYKIFIKTQDQFVIILQQTLNTAAKGLLQSDHWFSSRATISKFRILFKRAIAANAQNAK